MAGPALAEDDASCRAPAELAYFGTTLPVLTKALQSGEPVRIVALGSSSTQGAGASSKKACYPARLQAELRERFPKRDITVINLGIGGELASDMVERIGEEVLPAKPHLVIWQTGVNDALRKIDLIEFREQVREGLALLRAAGTDVVLLDQQYFPKGAKLPLYLEYVASMQDISKKQGVPLLRRFEIMEHLVSSAQFDINDLLAADRFHQNDAGYRCLGRLMADAIAHSVTVEKPKPGLHKASATALPGVSR